MGPKQKPKQKHKQPVVHEEDYVPINSGHSDNQIARKNHRNIGHSHLSKKTVPKIKTLIDYGIDAETVKILGDAKIWNSLLIKNNNELLAGVEGLSEIKFDPICEAVDKLMASLTSQVQVFTQSVLLENMPRKRCMSECIEACYSLDEMHETFSRKFGQSFKTTKNTYDYFLKGRHGSKAYKQLSLVRAAQRKSEKLPKAQSQKQQQLKVDKVCEAVDKSKLEQKEQAGNQFQKEQKEQAHSESLINSQKEILEAITSQNKMLESVMNLQTEIATKDDLESLERDLERRLEAIGEDITLQVANGIQEILTSASKTSVDKFEKAVTSKVNISR
ncbi:BnaC04g47890D [Brassica napus]|uniref:BnaC04g47890D protein n=1 Tax=Brassica napus TaxID=3708 RepID=A0A078FPJ4_BRANA|nr:BnaC04g47890D [Brassica napus]